MFQNEDIAAEEKKKYLEALERHEEGFSDEDLRQKEATLGVIVLITNSDKNPDEIYFDYKKRWLIETFFGVFRNDLDFFSLGIKDCYRIEAMTFILNIATEIRFKMRKALKNNADKKISSLLLNEVLDDLGYLKAYYVNNGWKIGNATITKYDYYQKLGINLTYLPKSD